MDPTSEESAPPDTTRERKRALRALKRRMARAILLRWRSGILNRAGERHAATYAALVDPETDPEAAFWLGFFHWLRCHARPRDPDSEDLAKALKLFALVYEHDPDRVPSSLRHYYGRQQREAETARALADHVGDPLTPAAAIDKYRAALAATPEDDPRYAERLTNLGKALADLFEDASHTTPGSHPSHDPGE